MPLCRPGAERSAEPLGQCWEPESSVKGRQEGAGILTEDPNAWAPGSSCAPARPAGTILTCRIFEGL